MTPPERRRCYQRICSVWKIPAGARHRKRRHGHGISGYSSGPGGKTGCQKDFQDICRIWAVSKGRPDFKVCPSSRNSHRLRSGRGWGLRLSHRRISGRREPVRCGERAGTSVNGKDGFHRNPDLPSGTSSAFSKRKSHFVLGSAAEKSSAVSKNGKAGGLWPRGVLWGKRRSGGTLP